MAVTRLQVSYYIRGPESSALVHIWVDAAMPSSVRAELAREEAMELGIYPSGTCIAYEVVEQDPIFYDTLIFEHDAKAMRTNPATMALVR